MHFHFIVDNPSVGGHLEGIQFKQLTVEIQKIVKIDFSLPLVEEMKSADMNLGFVPPAVP